MRNDWNWNGNWNRGPRGPRYGYRTHRRAGGGLIGLFGLLIGFRVILSVIGIAGVVIGAVFSGLAAVFSEVFSVAGSVLAGAFSHTRVWAGVAMGVMIGLILHRMIRAKKEERAEQAEARAEEATVEESGIVETTHYRFNA